MVTIDFNSFIIYSYRFLSYVRFCKFLRNSVFGLLYDQHVTLFYEYFAEMQNRSKVSEREFTRLVDRSVDPSLLGS